MSSGFSFSGLISGLDSDTLITQLMAIERQPILRLQDKIETLESTQSALRELRTQLQTLRNRAQDFRFNNIFSAYGTTTSDDTVATADVSSSNPVVGAYVLDVIQLASSTNASSSDSLGSSINPSAALDSSGINSTIEAGTFTINGVEFTVDPATDSLDDILAAINSSGAGVTASYDSGTDTVTFENTTAGDTSVINFGSSDEEGESNLLEVLGVTEATQSTGGSGQTVVTGTRNLGAIDATALISATNFANGAITAGSFSINGVSISVDPTEDTMLDVIASINSSDAGVTASFDSATDTIRFVSDTLGSRTIKFGGTGDTSNFLSITNLDTATQTAGKDAQFTINGGSVITRNTNEVSDAISGVTVDLLSVGETTIKVATDTDTIVEDVQTFIDEFNASVSAIRDLTSSDGALAGDSSIRTVENYLRTNIFAQVGGLSGEYSNFVEIGITTGEDFNASEGALLELDTDAFLEALRDDPTNIANLFSNDGGTGVADQLFDYLDEVTKATGFLNNRSKASGTIDVQIQSLNDQIDRIEDRVAQKEERLRNQFAQLEVISSNLQAQNSALAALG